MTRHQEARSILSHCPWRARFKKQLDDQWVITEPSRRCCTCDRLLSNTYADSRHGECCIWNTYAGQRCVQPNIQP
ncbi:hypothetical protein V1523DRAFT_402581 [Lipomyces doorenjongii]